jgi:NTP pyrophosphatase (non-canonical NTP hydrolase)
MDRPNLTSAMVAAVAAAGLPAEPSAEEIRKSFLTGRQKSILHTAGMEMQNARYGLRDFQHACTRWYKALYIHLANVPKTSVRIRCHRFIEEAIELVQALGVSKEDVLKWVDYVYGRPVGEPKQEVGGVMITLAVLCNEAEIKLDEACAVELHSVFDSARMEKIRAKQRIKNAYIGIDENAT